MQRESFFFRREWLNAIAHLPKDLRGELCLAIIDYALGEPEEALSEMAKAMFSAIKPFVEKDLAKVDILREAASKGGRAKNAKRQGSANVVPMAEARQGEGATKAPQRQGEGTTKAVPRQCQDSAYGTVREKKEEKEILSLSPTPPILLKEKKEKRETFVRTPAAETSKPRKVLSDEDLPPGFVAFWNAYPSRRRTDKKSCFKKWKDNGLEAQAAAIIADVKKRSSSDDWTRDNGSYIPLSTTYINQARWDCAEIRQISVLAGISDSSIAPELSDEEMRLRRRQEFMARYKQQLQQNRQAEQLRDKGQQFTENYKIQVQ